MSIFDSVRRWRAALQPQRDAAEAEARPTPPAPAPQPSAPTSISADAAKPAAEAAHVEPHGYDGPERRQKPRVYARNGIRALIVDDSTTIVAVLRKMLQQNGYVTLEAYNAEDALELIKRERPDLIFLDIVLPGMDGFSALRALRRDPETKPIPVIMISGNAQATEQFYVQRIGADDFMKKPFSRAEVFARIEHLLDDEGIPRRISTINPISVVPVAT